MTRKNAPLWQIGYSHSVRRVLYLAQGRSRQGPRGTRARRDGPRLSLKAKLKARPARRKPAICAVKTEPIYLIVGADRSPSCVARSISPRRVAADGAFNVRAAPRTRLSRAGRTSSQRYADRRS